jgi:hypothetical protein
MALALPIWSGVMDDLFPPQLRRSEHDGPIPQEYDDRGGLVQVREITES